MITIRKASIEDLKHLTVLFDKYRVFYKLPSDLIGAAFFLKERFTKNESVIFVAIINNEIIGFAQLYPIFSSVGLKRAWLLNDLYVDEKARGKGAAAALLIEAKQFGIETHAGWMLLQTAADNFIAQSVYEKHGWVIEQDLFYRLDLK